MMALAEGEEEEELKSSVEAAAAVEEEHQHQEVEVPVDCLLVEEEVVHCLLVAEVVVHCLTAPLAVEAEELEGQRQHRFDEEEEAGQDHALALEEVVSGKLEEH